MRVIRGEGGAGQGGTGRCPDAAAETRAILDAQGAARSASTRVDAAIHSREAVRQLLATEGGVTVRYQRIPSGWWIATAPGVDRFFARGRSIAEARRRLREELSELAGNGAQAMELAEEVCLPEPVRWRVREAAALRERAARAEGEARDAVREAVVLLTTQMGLSRRDTGEILGVSGQWVQCILAIEKGSYR